MKTGVIKLNIDGLIVRKTPLGDHHLLADLLLRSGDRISLKLYGGLSPKKNPLVELGMMVEFSLEASQTTQGASYFLSSKEWRLLWAHKFIRHDYDAYVLLCKITKAVCDVTKSFMGEGQNRGRQHDQDLKEYLEKLNQLGKNQGQGLFRPFSGAVFSLDESASLSGSEKKAKEELFLKIHFLFWARVIQEHGHDPELHHCVLTGQEFTMLGEPCMLIAQNGGFALQSSLGSDFNFSVKKDDSFLRGLLILAHQISWKDLASIPALAPNCVEDLILYYQKRASL